MMPKYHALASVVISVVFFYFTKFPLATLLCFLAGVAIDADHLIDFWVYKGKITISGEIFTHFHDRFGKIYVVFHSLEIVLILFLLGHIFPGVAIYLFAIAIGMLGHILLDFISYELHPMSYFLMYRVSKKFDKKSICLNEMEG